MHWLHWMERSFCFPALSAALKSEEDKLSACLKWVEEERSLTRNKEQAENELKEIRIEMEKSAARYALLARVWNRRRKSVMSLCAGSRYFETTECKQENAGGTSGTSQASCRTFL